MLKRILAVFVAAAMAMGLTPAMAAISLMRGFRGALSGFLTVAETPLSNDNSPYKIPQSAQKIKSHIAGKRFFLPMVCCGSKNISGADALQLLRASPPYFPAFPVFTFGSLFTFADEISRYIVCLASG